MFREVNVSEGSILKHHLLVMDRNRASREKLTLHLMNLGVSHSGVMCTLAADMQPDQRFPLDENESRHWYVSPAGNVILRRVQASALSDKNLNTN